MRDSGFGLFKLIASIRISLNPLFFLLELPLVFIIYDMALINDSSNMTPWWISGNSICP